MTAIDAAEAASPHPSGDHLTPSRFHGDRLEALRTEAGWSQAELAAKIELDHGRLPVPRTRNSRPVSKP